MKKLSVMTLALLPVLSSGAWERSESEMLHCARTQLNVKAAELIPLIEKDMLTVFGTEGGGYVVVSRSASSSPVIGYSDSPLDLNSIPDGLSWWLSYADRALNEREGKMYISPAPQTEVAPMLTTAWEQDGPYNSLCPSVGGIWGGKPMTGCVATAMAQALKYYQYPPKSVGKGSYSTDGQNFIPVALSTEYKWERMKDRYRLGYTEEEGSAVAELMRDCGYASKMVYTSQGSGTNLYDAGYGLTHNLQYDSLSFRIRTRAYHSDREWVEMVHAEMVAKRPVIYAATDPSRMAHAFVLDGLDSNGFVHVNWGWGGTANGYFDISVLTGLTPSYPDPYTGSQIEYNFCMEQLMATGLIPSSSPAEGAEYESFFGGYEYPELNFAEDALQISSIPVFNFSHLDFKGLLGLVIQGEDDHAVVLPFFYSAWEDGITIPVIGGIMLPEEFYAYGTLNETDQKTPRPDGKYRIYFVSWAEQEMAAGIEPRMFHYPVILDSKNESSAAVWEAEIRNGHWDASTLKKSDSEGNGIQMVLEGDADDPVSFYTLDGLELNGASLPKGQPVVIRRGNRTSKVMIR